MVVTGANERNDNDYKMEEFNEASKEKKKKITEGNSQCHENQGIGIESYEKLIHGV